MNFALSYEQMLLREAARGALFAPQDDRGRARGARGPGCAAGSMADGGRGRLAGPVDLQEHGGAGLDVFDALLVAEECGGVLASVPLLGLLPATAILSAAGDQSLPEGSPLESCARCMCRRDRRATLSSRGPSTTAMGMARKALRRARPWSGDQVTLDGEVAYAPDAPGAALLVAVGVDGDGDPVAVALAG